MSGQKKEKEPKILRLGAYDLDNYVPDVGGGRGNMSKDPLDEALNERARALIREAKELQLKKYITDMKKDLGQGEEQAAFQGGSNLSNTGVALLTMLIAQGMEPSKANEYIKALDNESIMKLSIIGAQNQNALLPMVLLASKQGTSLEDIVKVVGAIIAIAKPSGEGGNNAMIMKLVTETIPNMQNQLAAANTLAYQSQISQLRQELADIKPKNPMDYVKDVADAATALGMRAGSDVSLEVKKLELEDARETRRIKADRENTKEIIGTVKDLIEGRAGEVLSKIGDAGAERIRSGKGTQPHGGAPPSAETLMVQCGKCGGTFKINRDAKMVECPHCGTNLPVEFKPPTQEEREAQVPRVPEFGGGSGELTPRWSGAPEKE